MCLASPCAGFPEEGKLSSLFRFQSLEFEPNLKLWVNKMVGSPGGTQVGCAGTFPAPREETLVLQLSDRP